MFKSANREPREGVGQLLKGPTMGAGLAPAPVRGRVSRTLAQTRPAYIPADFTVDEQGFYKRYGKRLLDIAVSSLALLVLLPFFPIVALAIVLSSPGPILYRSTRLGRHGRAFSFYKFRSMFANAHEHQAYLLHLNEVDGPVFKLANDPRVTGVGRLLRRTSIDELPQLFNVLTGDMSLVGPRPDVPQQRSLHRAEDWALRCSVRPGITGLAQAMLRSQATPDERLALDLRYAREHDAWMDLRIIGWTLTRLSGKASN